MSKYSDLRETMSRDRASLLTEFTPVTTAVEPAADIGVLRRGWRTVRQSFALWNYNRRARRELAQLDTRSLQDIGIAPELADYEASRPFWRPLRNLRD